MVVVVTTSDVVMNISICTFSTTSLQQYTILHKRLQIYFDKFTPVQSSTCVRLLIILQQIYEYTTVVQCPVLVYNVYIILLLRVDQIDRN